MALKAQASTRGRSNKRINRTRISVAFIINLAGSPVIRSVRRSFLCKRGVKMLLKTAGGLSLILALTFVVQAKGWRGIVPLHSTRADVEQLLGTPNRKSNNKPVVRYDLEEETVSIIYSREPCSNGTVYGKWAVPPDTVVSIRVIPKKALPLSELKLDAAQYKVTHVRGVPSSTYYTDEGEGVQFDVSTGRVSIIDYFYAAEDEHLRCKTYTEQR
jgi:hypothetical protein